MNRRRTYADDEKAKRTAAHQKMRYRRRTGSFYGRHYWTSPDDGLVLAHALPDRVLAERLGVSVSAIQDRRYNLKRGAERPRSRSREHPPDDPHGVPKSLVPQQRRSAGRCPALPLRREKEGANEKRPAFLALPSRDVDHGENVWSKTITPPWTTVILTLVNAMSVIVALQLPFGQPAS
jgi:hypothetical protein